MKVIVIFLIYAVFSFTTYADTPFCDSKVDGRVKSDKVLSIYKIPNGVQYIFSVDSSYKDLNYNSSMVLVGDINNPDLLFFPELETSDDESGWLTGIFYNGNILKNAVLVVEYGNYCKGNGYEVSYSFSEVPDGT